MKRSLSEHPILMINYIISILKTMHLRCIVWIVLLSLANSTYGRYNPKVDSLLLKLDFDGSDFHLLKNFDFEDNGYKGVNYSYGRMPRARLEGESQIATEKISVVPSNLLNGANALQYTLGPQKATDHKARVEHYLFVGNLKQSYVSEFSMMLHPDFTPIDLTRIDGGTAWCCIRQWHQSSPESPPMGLCVKNGSNNILITEFHYGTRKKGIIRSFNSTEKTVQLGKWYHFRYEWHIDPGTDNSYCKIWMSDKRMGDELTDEDIWCDYKGQIGYTLEGKPESEMEDLSRNIREQQGLYQNTYIDPKSFHAVVYDNVRIYKKK